jgi:hypothetical protein
MKLPRFTSVAALVSNKKCASWFSFVIPELPPAMDVAPGLSRVGALALLSRSTVVLLPARAYLLAPTMNELDPSPPKELFVGDEMKSSPAESL